MDCWRWPRSKRHDDREPLEEVDPLQALLELEEDSYFHGRLDRMSAEPLKSFRHFPLNEQPTLVLHTTSLNCCLPATDATDKLEKKFQLPQEGSRLDHASALDSYPSGVLTKTKHLVDWFSRYDERSLCGVSQALLELEEDSYFHGRLDRKSAEPLLRRDGDFLVRETLLLGVWQLALSVRWRGQHRHFVIQTTPEGWLSTGGRSFRTVQDLVSYHLKLSVPLDDQWGAVLRRPVSAWLLSKADLDIGHTLGKGQFGEVRLAVLRNTGKQVAVKKCLRDGDVTLGQQRALLEEGRLMRRYQHPNVVRFIGFCLDARSPMVILEYVKDGQLRQYLRKNGRSLLPHQLVAMCRDVAHGMCYLESMNCVHRDLAARNCLKGDVVKISDFGLSREVEQYYRSVNQMNLPLKWMAPESVYEGQ
ncbi:tyrosine-protein kinase Fer-like [Schistocerca americana]|uniref:tyrosine-protein kinase Fer-like n=1 Tax=Schistocerca americana TaxID=7009 RepID=UPI001F4FFF01|nr:tyrosine-protein kinase Fer-like [Schistocerca americana]